MFKGDISDEAPRRIIVTIDAVTTQTVNIEKRWFGLLTVPQIDIQWDLPALNHWWRTSDRLGLRLELALVDVPGYDPMAVMDDLDRFANPFNSAVVYRTRADLIKDLPYRPDVVGVVDLPKYQLHYGSYALTEKHLGLVV